MGAVGGSAICRMRCGDSRFLVRISCPGRLSSSFRVGELAPNLFKKDETLSCSSVRHRNSLYRPNTYSSASTTSRRNRMRGASQTRLINFVVYPFLSEFGREDSRCKIFTYMKSEMREKRLSFVCRKYQAGKERNGKQLLSSIT